MTSACKQLPSCCNHFIDGYWGKDYLIPMGKPALSESQSTLAFSLRRLRMPERFSALDSSE